MNYTVMFTPCICICCGLSACLQPAVQSAPLQEKNKVIYPKNDLLHLGLDVMPLDTIYHAPSIHSLYSMVGDNNPISV